MNVQENRTALRVEALEDRMYLSNVPGAVELAPFSINATFIEAENFAYFSGNDLYKSDGTVRGTERVGFINPGGKLGPSNLTYYKGLRLLYPK